MFLLNIKCHEKITPLATNILIGLYVEHYYPPETVHRIGLGTNNADLSRKVLLAHGQIELLFAHSAI